MAHGLEARVPFLGLHVVRSVLALPAAWKIVRPDRGEKWRLRTAFREGLPPELLWRDKEQFGDGTGSSQVLTGHAAGQVDTAELAAWRHETDPPLRTAEAAYWKVFAAAYPDVDTASVVGRSVDA